MSRKLFLALPLAAASLLLSAHAMADTVAVWKMESSLQATLADGVTPVAGAVSFVGGATTSGFVAGFSSTDKAYNTTHYPAVSGADMSAGIVFATSTAGFQNVVISWDDKRSATAANTLSFQYSLDGVNFTAFGGVEKVTTVNWTSHSFDLSSIVGANDDANFAFRVLAAYDTTGNYVGTTSGYSTGGTIRYDNVTVSGIAAAVPEPESYAMMLAGLALLGAIARRKARANA